MLAIFVLDVRTITASPEALTLSFLPFFNYATNCRAKRFVLFVSEGEGHRYPDIDHTSGEEETRGKCVCLLVFVCAGMHGAHLRISLCKMSEKAMSSFLFSSLKKNQNVPPTLTILH